MTEQKINQTENQPQEKKKSGCLMKLFKLLLCLLLVIVVLWCIWFLIADREIKPVAVADVYEEVDASKGEVPDYKALYNSILEKEVFPTEENGWVDVFRALGPRSIEQSYEAERMKWEDFIADEDPTGAYQKRWKPLCEKLGLDPKEKPLFYDRLDIVSYLVKNGVRGDETPPEEENDEEIASFNNEEEEEADYLLPFHVPESYSYWEDAEERQGKISRTAANDEYIRLMEAPWTPEEHPIAAQWYAENEDMLDLIAQAARKPKYHGWHFVPAPDEGSFINISLPDAQYARFLARDFRIRALLRVGTGDISGAIDDLETIFSFSRHLIDDESCYVVERLVGVANFGMAAATPLYANPNARPSAEDRARVAAIFHENFGDKLVAARFETFKRAQMIHDFGAHADFIHEIGQGNTEIVSAIFYDGDDFFATTPGKLLVGVTPVDEPSAHNFFRQYYLELMETRVDDQDARLEELIRQHAWPKGGLSKTTSLMMLNLFFPAMRAVEYAYQRVDCSIRLAMIAQAIWAYYDDNGALPPAFTVDDNGSPLHSWRVLILPYLGEEEKALYDKIRLDEPWNSEHNKAFYAQIPDVYRCPSYKDLLDGETIYSVLTAQDGIFDRSGTGKDPNAIFQRENRDSANQLMLVERANPICWMTPDDELDVDHALDDESLDFSNFFGFKVHEGGCDAVTFGGATIFFAEARTTTPDVLRRDLFGEPLPEEEDETKEEEDEFLQNEM